MNILLCSHLFAPSVGGIESVSELLARAFVKRGHAVIVVTQTTGSDQRKHPFDIVRAPNFLAIRRLIDWCDIFFQNNISLQTAAALVGKAKPWFVTHQTWISREDGRLEWQDFLKRHLLAFTRGISVSKAIAAGLRAPSTIVGNPFDETVFREKADACKDGDLIFAGRLVSDKGVDLLLEAVSKLKAGGLKPSLTVIGTGPEREPLKALGQKLGIDGQINWAGLLTGGELADALNGHRVMVVPSRWNEPFGIVALEGIACGCIVVGSNGGGLPEAIGPCGITVPNGDVDALTGALHRALTDSELRGRLRENAPMHLRRHTSGAIADAYLSLFQQALTEGRVGIP